MKRVLVLRFDPSATQAQRQAAVDSVSGTVVGGSRMGASDGFYLVYVPAAVTVQGLDSLIVILERQPLVDMATYNAKFRDFHLRPVDGVGWQKGDWSLRPGATAVANTWLALVAAPPASRERRVFDLAAGEAAVYCWAPPLAGAHAGSHSS